MNIWFEKKKFCSSGGEEQLVIDFFDGKREGFFLDIGPADGDTTSNSFRLIHHFGWKGLVVESLQYHKKNLQIIYDKNVQVFNGAISEHEKELLIKQANDEHISCSFITEAVMSENASRPTMTKEYMAPALPINQLLSDYGVPEKIDFISLDIEISEIEILRNFDFDKYHVELWCVKDGDHFDELFFAKGYQKIETFGYPVLHDFFAKSDSPYIANIHKTQYYLPKYPQAFLQFNKSDTSKKIKLSFFSTTGLIQKDNHFYTNAFATWKKLGIDISIFGPDNPNYKKLLAEYNIRWLPESKLHPELKLPTLDNLLKSAMCHCSTEYICYINADIMLSEDFLRTFHWLTKHYEDFFMVGRRWDWMNSIPVDQSMKLDEIMSLYGKAGKRAAWGIDYFVFKQSHLKFFDVPPYFIPIFCGDNWFCVFPKVSIFH